MLRFKILFFGQKLIDTNPWYLAPFSWVYAFVVFCRNRLYDWRLLPVYEIDCPIVSVGNILAGGTGKTPFVHFLAKRFAHRKVAILSSGYSYDEPTLLARRLPNAKIYTGRDRVGLAREAKKEGAELILIDDGFQYRKLHRDFDIVLGDTKGHYLPWGLLRDSPQRKGDFFFPQIKHKVSRILSKEGIEIPTIHGWKVAIFCGIAKPLNFKKTILQLGAEIIAEKYFADHEPADLDKLPRVNALICTEKDFIKLQPTHLPIYYIETEMEIIGQEEQVQKLIEKIDQKIDNYTTL